jgi:hypothetical protein
MGQSESKIEADIAAPYFLHGAEASDALAKAETQDQYLTKIGANSINVRARSEFAYYPFAESKALETYVVDSPPFPRGQIVYMMPSADAGFPHTRGDSVICIPAYFPPTKLAQLLVHERIHLHQKQFSEKYGAFYKSQWGFTPNMYPIPEKIQKIIRLNPDTIKGPVYIWRDMWIPFSVFEREDRPNMRDCSTVWYNPKGGVLLKTMPPAWKEFFGDVSQAEHPNELSACYGADYEKYADCDAAKRFYAFLASSF